MSVIIRPYEKPDWPRLIEINIDAYEEEMRPPTRTMSSMLWLCETHVAVSCVGKQVVGFIMVHDSSPKYVWSIAVDPSYQGFGIGSHLMDTLDKYKGIEPIELHCATDNPAQKLYFDHGFRVVQVLQDYYPTSAGLLMRRQ